jgi:hypothetical protein
MQARRGLGRLVFDEHGDIINPGVFGIMAPEIIEEGVSSFYVRSDLLDSRLYTRSRNQAVRATPYTQHRPRDFRVDMRHGRPFNVDCTLRWIMFDNQQTCATVHLTGQLNNGRLVFRQSRAVAFHFWMWFADHTMSYMFYEYMLNGRQIFTNYSINLLRSIVRDGITFRADRLSSFSIDDHMNELHIVPRGSGPPHYIEGTYDFNTRQILIQGHGTRLILNIANNTEAPAQRRVGYEIVPEGRGFASFISDLRDVVDGDNNNDDQPGTSNRLIMTMPRVNMGAPVVRVVPTVPPVPQVPQVPPVPQVPAHVNQRRTSNSNSNRSNTSVW